MTTSDEHLALIDLVAPWLPNATIDTLNVQEQCGCYSEWTTEPPVYELTLRAPRPTEETDRALSNLVRVLEPMVLQFAQAHHSFTGCESCQGQDGDTSDVMPSCYVRIIPVKSSVAVE